MEFWEYDTRLAAYAVIVDDRDRILLALFNQGPTPEWTLPGGGIELHEVQGTTDEARWIPVSDAHRLPHVRIVASALRLLL